MTTRIGWTALALLGCVFALRAQTPPTTSSAPPPSDFASRIVAFLDGNEVITRQDLGEYLLARMGAKKVEDMYRRKLIDLAAKQGNVSVTDAEVEAAFNDALQGLPRDRFIKEVVRGHYGLTLFEWKEDRLRPKLMMIKLCRNTLKATEDEIRRMFEATYGERIQGRLIVFANDKEQEAQSMYATLRDSDEAFNEAARLQKVRGELASSAGKIRPIGRFSTNNEILERVAFTLKPGQVSELVKSPEGILLFKCDQRLPPDTSVNLEARRDELTRMVLDTKLKDELPKRMADIEKASSPQVLVKDWTMRAEPGQVVVKLGDGFPITREAFAEYLIARFGAEKLDLLVNSRVIHRAAKEKGVTATEAEVDAALADYVKARGTTAEVFSKQILKPNGQTLYEFREDFLRHELLMNRLVRPQVKPTDEEIQQAFEAYYGEKIECRIILYPRGEEKIAMQEYAQLRDSEDAFARKARLQASSQLASAGGKIPPVGKHTTGNEELEREIFSLNPGDCSRLIGSPEGVVLVKVDRRIPASTSVPLASVREKLVADILQRKVKNEVPRIFAELRKTANPRMLLKEPGRVEDLGAEVENELRQTGFIPPAPMK